MSRFPFQATTGGARVAKIETMPAKKITKIHTKNRRQSRIYLREWLEHRGLTAEALAARIDASKGVISKLENGVQRYNQDWLERIAWALNCEVRDLFRPPSDLVKDEQLREAARAFLQKTG
ncbi:hypothetical protein BH10PSE7_BH10PSE7_15170 [soil metagenome]